MLIASSKTAASAGVMTTSLKSLVKFLVSKRDCSVSWIPALQPPVKLHTLPSTRALDEDELSRLLGAFDRSMPLDKRDYAITRCLVDLGIRTSDVATLSLDQIDWRYGRVTLSLGRSKRERTPPMLATTT
jgi:site-specific recombinase XerC